MQSRSSSMCNFAQKLDFALFASKKGFKPPPPFIFQYFFQYVDAGILEKSIIFAFCKNKLLQNNFWSPKRKIFLCLQKMKKEILKSMSLPEEDIS